MDSLQSISLTKFLANIPQNAETKKILDDFVLSYVKENKYIIDEYIHLKGLYNIFVKPKDFGFI